MVTMVSTGNAQGAAVFKPRQARRKTQEERSTATRDALIRAAIDLIAERGYAATTTNLVADRAGLSRGALQHHFKSRDEMIAAVMDRLRSAVSFRVDPGTLINRPLEERIDAIVEHYRAMCRSREYRAALNLWIGIDRIPRCSASYASRRVVARRALRRTGRRFSRIWKLSRGRYDQFGESSWEAFAVTNNGSESTPPAIGSETRRC